MAETTPDDLFALGKRYYTNAEYESAIETFARATIQVPDSSVYHHWLGKSYGRLAENSGIISAYHLSKKTREELELAVELDGTNRGALADLMEYYRQAPPFLGGGNAKAENIRLRLEALDQGMDTASQP